MSNNLLETIDVKAIKDNLIEKNNQVMKSEESEINDNVHIMLDKIINIDLDNLSNKQNLRQYIDDFGLEYMKQSSRKNELLSTTVGKLSQSGDEGGLVSKGLMDLEQEMKDLDPNMLDFTKTGFLGKIFNPIRGYFAKYEKADSVITNIVDSINKGKEIIKNDNITLDIEQQELREISLRLSNKIEFGMKLDELIEGKLKELEEQNADIEKINFIREEILYPLRQRVLDMQSEMTIDNQGYVAIETIKRNNKELIRGAERATTVTVSALRIAVMVASALYNQKIVLTKIQHFNEATNNIISATSKMLKEQGTIIHQDAANSNLNVDTLKQAFSDCLEAFHEVSVYKQNALPIMKEQINTFAQLAQKGEAEIQKIEAGNDFYNNEQN